MEVCIIFILVFLCMYVCMYVCTAYTYLCAYVFMYVCIHVRMYVFIYVGMHIFMYACMYLCTYACIYVHIYVCTYVFIHYSNVCMCVCIHYVCKQTRTYTYTHHIRNVSPPQHTAHMSPPPMRYKSPAIASHGVPGPPKFRRKSRDVRLKNGRRVHRLSGSPCDTCA